MPARMQRVEIGITVNAQDHSLAVDDKMLGPVLQCSFNDPGESLCPIVSASGNQPNPIAIALNAQPVAVVLDLVKPLWTGGDLYASGWKAELVLAPT